MSRILLVDDEKHFREAVAEALRLDSHVVEECSDAAQGEARLKAQPFDVIISDLRMPGKSGLEFLEGAARLFPGTILILLSAYSSVEPAIDRRTFCLADVLAKPISLKYLTQRVETLVAGKTDLREKRRT
jgi:DNA-binding NtrC family response regulator